MPLYRKGFQLRKIMPVDQIEAYKETWHQTRDQTSLGPLSTTLKVIIFHSTLKVHKIANTPSHKKQPFFPPANWERMSLVKPVVSLWWVYEMPNVWEITPKQKLQTHTAKGCDPNLPPPSNKEYNRADQQAK